jgi:hypothetical protein
MIQGLLVSRLILIQMVMPEKLGQFRLIARPPAVSTPTVIPEDVTRIPEPAASSSDVIGGLPGGIAGGLPGGAAGRLPEGVLGGTTNMPTPPLPKVPCRFASEVTFANQGFSRSQDRRTAISKRSRESPY